MKTSIDVPCRVDQDMGSEEITVGGNLLCGRRGRSRRSYRSQLGGDTIDVEGRERGRANGTSYSKKQSETRRGASFQAGNLSMTCAV
jgi:hypothetical protein